ncbi:MAG: 4Fe-4S binding protein [Lachnospiraceae bacterium]|jgi:coenzyme F420-reducing hydrogenase beta subunit|nr:Coenzyme F420 hydrogenase/dehydrogenase, beta subunit C-terminal domain [uncultured Acetatifactor sp.]MCI9229921.1 4Fe-4S binding protein [Lachnospiraceae bacterium]MCI9571809.1 4Fe-4S binding protein [Lachnospiraceae bacterium]
MELYREKKTCCGCGACADICPVGAIHMVMDEEGFRYPKVNEKKCTKCGKCASTCPMKGRKAEETEKSYFGIRAKERGLRLASSSGGMFPLLADYVFRRQGVVYGAAYDGNMKVAHGEARDRQELDVLKRTKYVQSDLTGTYRRIRRRLEEGRWVLFCGTPCQAQALRLFLGRAYPKLIMADLVCYGAPSPGIWEAYVKSLERKRGGKMTAFSFRDKRAGDNGHTCAYVVDGREYARSLNADLFCRMYFTNHSIRPSCHACGYCTVDRDSDFTLGDFWGIEKVRPDMDDGMGTSMVILHTGLAREIWEEVKGETDWFPCGREDVLQPRLKAPTQAAAGRARFMDLYRRLPFPLFLKWFWLKQTWTGAWRRLAGGRSGT